MLLSSRSTERKHSDREARRRLQAARSVPDPTAGRISSVNGPRPSVEATKGQSPQ
jgi:hypothetical protein